MHQLGTEIEGPNNWEILGVRSEEVVMISMNYLISKSLLVVQAALEEALGRKLPGDYYNLVLLCCPKTGEYRECRPFEVFTHKEKGLDGVEITPLSVMSYATDPLFKVAGWEFDIPHPASIAAVAQVQSLLKFLMKGVPGFNYEGAEAIEILKKFTREVGLSVSAVLPKEAAKLMKRDSSQDEYLRHQAFMARTILRSYQAMKQTGSGYLVFPDIQCEFRLPRCTGKLENLLVRRLPQGNEEREKDFYSLFCQVVGPPDQEEGSA